MTTKKFANHLEKQSKGSYNISLEPLFGEYLVKKNGRRIGVVFENCLYLTQTDEAKAGCT